MNVYLDFRQDGERLTSHVEADLSVWIYHHLIILRCLNEHPNNFTLRESLQRWVQPISFLQISEQANAQRYAPCLINPLQPPSDDTGVRRLPVFPTRFGSVGHMLG